MPITDDDTNPEILQEPVTVRDDGGLEVPASRARQASRGSLRPVIVLGISLFAAAAAMGLYWARMAPALHDVDQRPGELAASGQTTTDPKLAGMFDHPAAPAKTGPAANTVGR